MPITDAMPELKRNIQFFAVENDQPKSLTLIMINSPARIDILNIIICHSKLKCPRAY